jgi:hypothetical protein
MLARLALTLALLPALAAGETIRIGAGERFARPSQAAAAAQEGDILLIAPGHYTDCAIWRTPRLTIAAGGNGAVEISGPTCSDKALFVIAAEDITVVGITFRGAVSSSGNGAGIRAEGGSLTIRHSRFEGNENGVLTADNRHAVLLVEDSVFLRNGALRSGHACAHGLYAGRLKEVLIRRSRFEGTRICHHVKSRAARTEVVDSEILDTPDGRASYLIDVPNGGDLLVLRNTLRKGPFSGNPSTAIAIGFEGVSQPTASLRIQSNRFESVMQQNTVFVRNRSETPVELEQNRLYGTVRPLGGRGSWR